MKRILSMLLVLMLLVGANAALAEDLGVQVIGAEQAPAAQEDEELSLDDLKLGKVYRISGNAIVAPRSFQFADCFAQYTKDSPYAYNNTSDKHKGLVFSYAYSQEQLSDSHYRWYLKQDSAVWMDAGEDCQFAWFRVDITNVNSKVKDLTASIEVKVVYADEYEFGGWIRLIDSEKVNLQYSDGAVSRRGFELTQHPSQIATHPENVEPVDYMQTGYYALGCTLPRYVIQDEAAPLRLEIKVGGEVLTYHIRK